MVDLKKRFKVEMIDFNRYEGETRFNVRVNVFDTNHPVLKNDEVLMSFDFDFTLGQRQAVRDVIDAKLQEYVDLEGEQEAADIGLILAEYEGIGIPST